MNELQILAKYPKNKFSTKEGFTLRSCKVTKQSFAQRMRRNRVAKYVKYTTIMGYNGLSEFRYQHKK